MKSVLKNGMKMSFGIKNSGATLVREMRKLLEELDHLERYINDFVIYTKDWILICKCRITSVSIAASAFENSINDILVWFEISQVSGLFGR